MGNNPGLAAAGTRQDQKRPLGVTHRLPLAGVQPFEKVHEIGNISIVTCWDCDIRAALVLSRSGGHAESRDIAVGPTLPKTAKHPGTLGQVACGSTTGWERPAGRGRRRGPG